MRVRNVGDARRSASACTRTCTSGANEDGGIGGAELRLPARTALETEGGLPTGAPARFHGAVGRIGDRAFDNPLTDLERDDDGWARSGCAARRGARARRRRVWPWLQIYTGDALPEGQRRRSLAVEPMTCPPNALADGVDLVVLEPGADWSGTWTLAWTAA